MSRLSLGIAFLVAVQVTACSSSNNATGTGGSGATGTAGTSGTAGTTGAGGTAGAAGGGDAGTTGGGGSAAPEDGGAPDAFRGTPDAGAPYAAVCAATVRNKGTCSTATDVQCANTCGPNRSGYKNCDCFTDIWSCPRCEYVPGDYSCYRLPDPLEACPMVENDAGSSLPQVGTTCTRAACSPCGSATLLAYLDSAGSPKVGYCVCGNEQKWTCASTTEWPQ